jgi:hypothetical protein
MDGKQSTSDKQMRAGNKPALSLLCDGLWLLALMAYAVAGVRLAPFHGDESMQIYASHDYAMLFIHWQPQQLLTSPPYPVDSDQHLRIINGSINRYTIGLAWQLAGLSEAGLPRLWSWPESYEANLAAGRRPSDALLAAARIPSTAFLLISIAVMFALGWQIGKRPVAYLSSALYALNPIILLNGRRAMQEGAFLCFGLLALLVAAIIIRHREAGSRREWPWWAGLALVSGLALASKHNTALFVLGAFVSIATADIIERRWKRMPATLLKLAASGIAAAGLFIALSPALWNNPIARLGDLATARTELLQGQIRANAAVLLTPGQRLGGMVTQPFLTAPQYYEAAFWADADPINAEIARYEASRLGGLPSGLWLGIPLTAAACLGIIALVLPKIHLLSSWAISGAMLVWLVVMIAATLANPLPWQRYSLQEIPLAALLAGIGVVSTAQLVFRHRMRKGQISEQKHMQSTFQV